VLAGPMLLPPQDEDRLRGELASPDPDDGGISTALLVNAGIKTGQAPV